MSDWVCKCPLETWFGIVMYAYTCICWCTLRPLYGHKAWMYKYDYYFENMNNLFYNYNTHRKLKVRSPGGSQIRMMPFYSLIFIQKMHAMPATMRMATISARKSMASSVQEPSVKTLTEQKQLHICTTSRDGKRRNGCWDRGSSVSISSCPSLLRVLEDDLVRMWLCIYGVNQQP